jgi:hypothetical protein
MSVYGCLFLLLSVVCGALSLGSVLPDYWNSVALGATAAFGFLFAGSLVVGRRIKFDPVLR